MAMRPMRLGTPQPPLEGATEWRNGQPTATAGRPLLVHFWSISCHICHETMPALNNYREQYPDLDFVAVHMPRSEGELDVAKVEADIEKMQMGQPVAIDNRHELAKAFSNQYVPAFFLFDQEGKLFFRTAGDKGFEKLEPKIKQVLGLEG